MDYPWPHSLGEGASPHSCRFFFHSSASLSSSLTVCFQVLTPHPSASSGQHLWQGCSKKMPLLRDKAALQCPGSRCVLGFSPTSPSLPTRRGGETLLSRGTSDPGESAGCSSIIVVRTDTQCQAPKARVPLGSRASSRQDSSGQEREPWPALGARLLQQDTVSCGRDAATALPRYKPASACPPALGTRRLELPPPRLLPVPRSNSPRLPSLRWG